MRVCYFGAYRSEYSRNRILIEGLRRNGVEVIECHEQLWHSIEDRIQAVEGAWKRPSFWLRLLRVYGRLLRKYAKLGGAYDVMVVGYPGQFDVFLARLLSWRHGRPLVWDIFMSIYLISLERSLHRRSPFAVDMIRRIEGIAARLPDRLILDTQQYVEWFARMHGVAPGRFRLLPTGADSDRFHPASQSERSDTESGRQFRVLYYGTYIPNHGVPTIIEAARRLAPHSGIRFELIGDGPQRPQAEGLARRYGLDNVAFVNWLDQDALCDRIGAADLCLGVFGTTPQSMMTVQNKIYEGLAMAKPVLTGDGPAVRDAFRHREHLYLCARADPLALAAAIVELQQNPALRANMAQAGYERFRRHFSVEELGRRFAQNLYALLEDEPSSTYGSQPQT
jgi:glycosyltransferase involved in cell wall biosynthesis